MEEAQMGKATSKTAARGIAGGGVGMDYDNASRSESGVDEAAAGRADGRGAHERGGPADAFICVQMIADAERIAEDDSADAHRVVRRSKASAEQCVQWGARRAAFHWNDVGTGNAAGSADGRWQAHVWVLQCRCCDALVDWRSACNRAKRAGRMAFVDGDGCSGKGVACGGSGYRRRRHSEGQVSMRARLDAGRSMLVEWPTRRDARAWLRAEGLSRAAEEE